MKLTLPYPPTVNTYWRNVGRRVLISRTGRAYKAIVASLATVARVRPIDGPVRLTIDVYRPRKAGDLDNILKAALDSVKGFLFHDDAQVIDIRARRFDDKDNPRAEIEAEPAMPAQRPPAGGEER